MNVGLQPTCIAHKKQN